VPSGDEKHASMALPVAMLAPHYIGWPLLHRSVDAT
jgi:hypothetical protein